MTLSRHNNAKVGVYLAFEEQQEGDVAQAE